MTQDSGSCVSLCCPIAAPHVFAALAVQPVESYRFRQVEESDPSSRIDRALVAGVIQSQEKKQRPLSRTLKFDHSLPDQGD